MTYANYLNTTHWHNIKEKTYIPHTICSICSSKKDLNIHHRKYRSNGKSILFREQPRHLLVMCQRCHYKWHAKHQRQKLMKHHLFRVRYLKKYGVSPLKSLELCTSVNKCNEFLSSEGLPKMPFRRKELFKLFSKSSGSA